MDQIERRRIKPMPVRALAIIVSEAGSGTSLTAVTTMSLPPQQIPLTTVDAVNGGIE